MKTCSLVFILLLSLFIVSCTGSINDHNDRKVYVVYMGNLGNAEFTTAIQHMSMLEATLGSQRAKDSWLHSFNRSFNGFVAKLSHEEKNEIASLDGVISVFPSTKKKLHTTRSWDFMGFPMNVPRTTTESDLIIGMLDTGIWPESGSFTDTGYGPPPSKWKGSCQSSSSFACNNKIVGARYYHVEGIITAPDVASPRDTEGHGSHTASIAAGSSVVGASLNGLGGGTARGGVPSARIAVYKICWSDGCSDADILAAFDDAIADGVDLISISVGGPIPKDYFEEAIAIGAFHAMKNGILTSNSAGNTGPDPESIVNTSPWSLSVAANTIDRTFLANVQLGNNRIYEGEAINTFELENDGYPLVYGGNVPNTAGGFDGSVSRYCELGSLDPELVKGAIVFCDWGTDAEGAAAAGATGTIMQGVGNDISSTYPLPASTLGPDDGARVYEYINTSTPTSTPTAKIFKSFEVKDYSAPLVLSFSSRGPNAITREILKPDLTAPGVSILAAWSMAATVTGSPEDKRIVPYNIISGTSMSCPHASGAAAYIKSFNPTWSPAAIKSALMTTATPLTAAANADAEFAYGSGQMDPLRAVSPGLLYDITETEYVNFLCGQGYSNKSLQLVTGDNSICTIATTVYDLNYPSFSLSAAATGTPVSRVFQRTVTNVGSPTSTYTAVVAAPSGLSIEVEPNTLSFQALLEKQSFAVIVTATTVSEAVLSGSIVWDDGTYRVRSPVVAFAD